MGVHQLAGAKGLHRLKQVSGVIPAKERASHYRQLAAKAVQSAETATIEELRCGYLNLAMQWHALAMEVERIFGSKAAARDRN